jgi:hypothetical protein
VQKTLFFCDVTKVENIDKKFLPLSKKNKQSSSKHIRFGRSKSPVTGLKTNRLFSLRDAKIGMGVFFFNDKSLPNHDNMNENKILSQKGHY